MVINKLKAGMTVYDVKKSTGLHSFNGKYQWWTIRVIEVDLENNKVFASWNCNTAKWYPERVWKKWRLNYPKE